MRNQRGHFDAGLSKGSFTIIDIHESVQSTLFNDPPPPTPKAYSKMLIFFPVIIIR